jgi:hypothetical protein
MAMASYRSILDFAADLAAARRLIAGQFRCKDFPWNAPIEKVFNGVTFF